LALRAFVRLEYHRAAAGVSWFQARWDVIRAYLANPCYRLPAATTA
jgi:hypothetical protein